jgi:hypothetical protein
MSQQSNPQTAGVPGLPSANYTPVSSNTTIVVKTGTGIFGGLYCSNAGSAWTYTVYDNTAGSGQVLATGTFATGPINLTSNLGINTTIGLTLVTAGTTPGAAYIIWL